MPLTQLEQRLWDVARGRIARGELPCVAPPLRMWGGYGQREGCDLCDTMIKPSEVALEVEESIEGKVKVLWFHIVCQSIWQLECARAEYLKNRVVSPDV